MLPDNAIVGNMNESVRDNHHAVFVSNAFVEPDRQTEECMASTRAASQVSNTSKLFDSFNNSRKASDTAQRPVADSAVRRLLQKVKRVGKSLVGRLTRGCFGREGTHEASADVQSSSGSGGAEAFPLGRKDKATTVIIDNLSDEGTSSTPQSPEVVIRPQIHAPVDAEDGLNAAAFLEKASAEEAGTGDAAMPSTESPEGYGETKSFEHGAFDGSRNVKSVRWAVSTSGSHSSPCTTLAEFRRLISSSSTVSGSSEIEEAALNLWVDDNSSVELDMVTRSIRFSAATALVARLFAPQIDGGISNGKSACRSVRRAHRTPCTSLAQFRRLLSLSSALSGSDEIEEAALNLSVDDETSVALDAVTRSIRFSAAAAVVGRLFEPQLCVEVTSRC